MSSAGDRRALTDVALPDELEEKLIARLVEDEARVTERTQERDRIWRLSRELMLVADVDSTVLAVNPAWAATLGWTDADLLGHKMIELATPADRDLLRASCRVLPGNTRIHAPPTALTSAVLPISVPAWCMVWSVQPAVALGGAGGCWTLHGLWALCAGLQDGCPSGR